MEVLHARCAGLDVHKDMVVAGMRLADGGSVKTEVRMRQRAPGGRRE
jgi:hypothetical protein